MPDLAWQVGQNPPLVPSLLYLENAAQGRAIAGQAVRDRGLDVKDDPRFFSGFKRGIGTPVRGFLPELDGETVTFERVGRQFLAETIAALRNVPLPVDSLILTVPVDSFEAYRLWLGEACRFLHVDRVRTLDEPTAAALGYGLEDSDLLLVVDFGGGTLDLSLVRLDRPGGTQPLGFILKWGEKFFDKQSGQRPNVARVLAKAGQNLGGTDIDNWLLDFFARERGLPKTALTRRLAEKLKIQLSTRSPAREAYFDDETFESYTLELDRDRFDTILEANQFFDRFDGTLTRVLQEAKRQGIETKDIDAVLLVGGTARIPAVLDRVCRHFPVEKVRAERTFDAIAAGALQIDRGMEVRDFLYHSYGIRYWDRRNDRHSWHPIVRAGQPYPMEKPVELLLGASLENQPSVELVIGEMGEASAAMEVYFDGDRLVTRPAAGAATVQPLNDSDGGRTIAQLDPPGFPGSDRVKVLFRVDEERCLRITVEDLLSDRILLQERSVARLS